MTKAELHRLVDRLPDDVVARLEQGSAVTLTVTDDGGRLVLREIEPEQAWFWTAGWQRGEREVDAEIAAGQLERFSDDEEFLAALTADLKPLE
jgi:hypothetical protein